MKPLLEIFAFIFLCEAIILSSCKKEQSCQVCGTNRTPIANAGRDTVIVLPHESALLDGSASTDPDGNITSYKWMKVAGPASATLTDATITKTLVKDLVEGVYKFELTVIDNGGLSGKDTVQVMVLKATITDATSSGCDNSSRLTLNPHLIPIGELSQPRDGVAVASAGNKILFAGGYILPDKLASRVDIFDLTTQKWTTAELSQARYLISAIGSGNKVIFAGGEISDGTFPTKTVDIFDVSTNTWSVSALSIPGNGVVAAAVGDAVLFGGGDAGFALSYPASWERTKRVDIYNLKTNAWTTSSFSTVRRSGHAAVTLDNKVYFSGGESWPADPVPGTWFTSSTTDIYDNATNTWSTSSLTQGRLGHAGIAFGDRIFWAGGSTGSFPSITNSCSVEIRDINTGNVSIQQLSSPGYRIAVKKNTQLIFYDGEKKFDVYDAVLNQWLIGVLPTGFTNGRMISVNNTVYITDGKNVYQMEF